MCSFNCLAPRWGLQAELLGSQWQNEGLWQEGAGNPVLTQTLGRESQLITSTWRWVSPRLLGLQSLLPDTSNGIPGISRVHKRLLL